LRRIISIIGIISAIAVWIVLAGPAEAQDEPPRPTTEEEIVDALTPEEGKKFTIGDKTYVWEDGLPYQVDEQGNRWLVKAPDKDDDIFELRDGQRWLKEDDADTKVYLTIAPKALATIYFDYNSARIKKESYPVLDEFGKALTRRPLSEARLIVAGHTDSKGSDDYNKKLSEKRAVAVGEYLAEKHDMDPERVILQGYGEAKPIADNETEKGRSANRRVEFILLH
jgi:outer membrane protein OmpA-like peptidoglycan-associated protein